MPCGAMWHHCCKWTQRVFGYNGRKQMPTESSRCLTMHQVQTVMMVLWSNWNSSNLQITKCYLQIKCFTSWEMNIHYADLPKAEHTVYTSSYYLHRRLTAQSSALWNMFTLNATPFPWCTLICTTPDVSHVKSIQDRHRLPRSIRGYTFNCTYRNTGSRSLCFSWSINTLYKVCDGLCACWKL